MLNKYLFGLLVNTIAIFASISSDVVAHGDIRDFRNQINQIYWDSHCSYREFYIQDDIHATEDTKENAWILEPKYKDSRTKVIGNAIADCVTGENEFAGKKPNDIITFKGTKPETYKQKHWNAVILYNYIHAVINGGNQSGKVKEVLKDKLDELKKNYRDEYNEAINKAVEYIQDYVRALKLEAQLYEFRQSKQEYDNNQDIKYIAPFVRANDFDKEKLKFCCFFYKSNKNSEHNRWRYSPTFRYYDGKLYIAKLKVAEDKWYGSLETRKGEWVCGEDKSIGIKELCGKQELYQFLQERLEGLVELPNEKLWNEWNRKS